MAVRTVGIVGSSPVEWLGEIPKPLLNNQNLHNDIVLEGI